MFLLQEIAAYMGKVFAFIAVFSLWYLTLLKLGSGEITLSPENIALAIAGGLPTGHIGQLQPDEERGMILAKMTFTSGIKDRRSDSSRSLRAVALAAVVLVLLYPIRTGLKAVWAVQESGEADEEG